MFRHEVLGIPVSINLESVVIVLNGDVVQLKWDEVLVLRSSEFAILSVESSARETAVSYEGTELAVNIGAVLESVDRDVIVA